MRTNFPHHLLFVVGCGVICLCVVSGFPFAKLFAETGQLRAMFRISFATLFLVRLWRLEHSRIVMFGRKTHQSPGPLFPHRIFQLQGVLAVLLLVGFVTDIVALLLFGTVVVINTRSKYYTIEDMIIQILLLHLPFLGTGEVLSIDSQLGLASPLATPSMLTSLFLTTGILLLSGGYEKIKNETWQRGKAAGYYLNAPHLMRPFFARVDLSELYPLLNYTIMLAEAAFLFSVLNKNALILSSIVLIGFAVSLFSISSLSFIGEFLLLVHGLFLVLVIGYYDQYPAVSEITLSTPGSEQLFVLALTVPPLVVTMYPAAAAKVRLNRLQQYLSGINTPIGVFNDRHLFGLYTFKLTAINGDGDTVLEVFDSKGFLGPLQHFRPRYLQSSMYVLTDFCLSVHSEDRELSDPTEAVLDLCYAGLIAAGSQQGSVSLSVKRYDADKPEEYLTDSWTEIGRYSFDGEEYEWQPIAQPPEPRQITR